MASGIKYTVAFKRFKWNRPGYAEVMNSGGVQSILSGKAGEARLELQLIVQAGAR